MNNAARFVRQIVYPPFGLEGQKALSRGRVAIVGVGGLGSWAAELLVRAGVGFVRLIDRDRVDITNIHRQALYEDQDAKEGQFKAEIAAARLQMRNEGCECESIVERLDRHNADHLLSDVDVVVDGTDNFATRFLLNDYCVKINKPWIFAGAVGAEAQTASIVPGRTPCLRCVLDEIPPPCEDADCRQAGVFGMTVAAVASFQAMEVVKILAGRFDDVSPYVLKYDMWTNTLNRLNFRMSNDAEPCVCCGLREFEYLEP